MTAPAFTEPVTLVTRTKTGVDGYGNDVYGTATSSVAAVFAPGVSIEQTDGRDTVITQPTVYLPTGTDVTAIDRVTIGADTYEVDGDPKVWPRHPFTGWQPALSVVVPLRKVTG